MRSAPGSPRGSARRLERGGAQKPQQALARHRRTPHVDLAGAAILGRLARHRAGGGVAVAAMVAAIDAVRGEASLSSAIRLFVYSRMAPETMTASVRIGG